MHSLDPFCLGSSLTLSAAQALLSTALASHFALSISLALFQAFVLHHSLHFIISSMLVVVL